MNLAVVATPRWQVSTRRTGEVFAAGAESEGCQILLLGIPPGFTAEEVEGWLHDLMGVARETSKQDNGARPIPLFLHHTLTGLLFSHGELWDNSADTPPCSAAFVQTRDAAAFGWAGDAEPRVWLNGQSVDIEWVVVRDQTGRQARAFGVDAKHHVRLELEWSSLPGATGVPGIVLSAVWNAPAPAPRAGQNPAPPGRLETVESVRGDYVASAPGLRSAAAEPPPASAPPAAAGPPAAHEAVVPLGPDAVEPAPGPELENVEPRAATPSGTPPHKWTVVYEGEDQVVAPLELPPDEEEDPRRRGFFAWVSGLLKGRARPAPLDPLDEVIEGRIVAPGDAGDWQNVSVHAPHPAPAGEGDAQPPAPERIEIAGVEPLLEDSGPPLPEMIPPSPEPGELTARTVDWRASMHRPPELRVPRPSELEPPEIAAPIESLAAPSIEPEPAFVETPADEAGLEAPVARPRPRRTPRHAWPAIAEAEPERPAWKKHWVWGAVLAALFAGGWLIGTVQQDVPGAERGPNLMTRVLRVVGLGAAHFEVAVSSRPPGAWIAVGAKDLARRTPATIELPPGEQTLTLSLPDQGSASFNVRGEKGDRLVLDAPLWGSLAVLSVDSGLPITLSLDGRPKGFVPVTLDSVLPGPHEVRFSGPGLASWGQTVNVRIGETAEVIARPMSSPLNGVIEVRAVAAGSNAQEGIEGAAVWVDGERKGATPLTLELPRGPHSVRVEQGGESAPVQVIDLPGGNQRFATFEFGGDLERPALVPLSPPATIPLDRPTMISAALQGVTTSDVREMWLHVRTPDGTWRRYQMAMMKASGGVVGVAVYPPTMFDDHGHGTWYVSAGVQTGDEYFTELQRSDLAAPPAAAPRR